MAWVTEYDLTWNSGSIHGDILIQRDGGSYQQPLTLARDTLEIKTHLPSWEEPVVRMNSSFTIINDLSDFYELLPLMTISNGQLRVVVTMHRPYAFTIFEGLMNPEAIDQQMLFNSPIRFTASGMLNKLKYDHPTNIDTIQNMSFIDIIDACLLMTGVSYDIYINCRLFEMNSTLTDAQTLFNRNGVSTEIFWKNNIERMTASEIIETILRAFNCYLYWYNEDWYIEHYENLGDVPAKAFVKYTSGTSAGYGFDSSGVYSSQFTYLHTYDIHNPTARPQVGESQILSVIPGMKIIQVRKDQLQFFNLINSDFTGFTTIAAGSVHPSWREWIAYDNASMDWEHVGSWRNIAHTMFRSGYSVISDQNYGNGLSTRFKLTVTPDMMLTLRFKYGISNTSVIPGYTGNLNDYKITFHWWLRNISLYFMYGESADMWSIGSIADGDIIQGKIVNGSEFDADLLTVEVSITIPIGDVLSDSSGDTPDVSLEFGIGHEQWELIDEPSVLDDPLDTSYFGDAHASVDEPPENNLITGEINTDFLDKKTIDINLFDANWQYRNAIYYDTDFLELTTYWGYDSEMDTLARMLLASKFRLYNVARQQIKLNYIIRSAAAGYIRPLSLFYDNKQSNKTFILCEHVFHPEQDDHEIVLREYDNTTSIILV